tara:strand:+ start:754 stop:1422 length:669 start_codon:yes stop_codon:yes gene_type:complete
MVSEQEKQIYNSYLLSTRSAKGQPTKFRKDFSKLKDEDFVTLKKLSAFFRKHNHINYKDWFDAPFEVYSKDEYFDLRFFTTRKALKCYSIFMKDREVTNPDSEGNIEVLKDGFRYVAKFCINNSITLDEYRTHYTNNMPTCLLHLQEHRLNFYTLHALNVEPTIKAIEKDVLEFIVKDFYTIFAYTRTKFYGSAILKTTAKETEDKVKTIVEKQKNNSKIKE